MAEFDDTTKRYRITYASSERYDADWVTERFAKAGARLKCAVINSQSVKLLDHPNLVSQLCGASNVAWRS